MKNNFSMKTYRFLLMAVLALSASACADDPDPQVTTPEQIVLEADENISTFDVTSTVPWTMTISDPWFKITPKHGNGHTTLKIGVDRNKTGAERTSTLEFVYGDGATLRIPVSQAAYTVDMQISAPQSVVVEKGKQLTVTIQTAADDWTYQIENGDWLKAVKTPTGEELDDDTGSGEGATTASLLFDLDPSVAFDESTPARITFSSPSDPTFEKIIEIQPVDFVEFSASAPESIKVIEGGQLTVDVQSNVDDWSYETVDGPWLAEASKSATQLVFNLLPDNLTSVDTKAKINFSSPSYANLKYSIEIQPVSDKPIVTMVDKSKCRAFVLDNDFTFKQTALIDPAYLFDGKWLTNKNDYSTVAYKQFGTEMSTTDFNSGHGDSFTIDAGEMIRLAKFVTYQYCNYCTASPLEYEIYAYTGEGEPQDDWSNWKLLGKVDVKDLYPIHKAMADKTYSESIANGDVLTIDEKDAVEARYYRFKMLTNAYSVGKTAENQWWTGRVHWMSLAEVSLYKYE